MPIASRCPGSVEASVRALKARIAWMAYSHGFFTVAALASGL
jgi:hypothetical protein